MAYTLPVMDMDGTTGHASWYLVDPFVPSDDAPMTDPYTYVSRVLFHSMFDYFEITYDASVSYNFPSRTQNPATSTITQEYTHTVGLTLPSGIFNWVLFWEGVEMKNTTLQFFGGRPIRQISPSRSGTSVIVTEVLDGTLLATSDLPFNWPSTTGTLRAIGFEAATETDATNAVDINPSAGVVQFGNGKLDLMARDYLRATAAGIGTHKITQGKSIDGTSSGVKFWNADGTTTTFGSYGGGYGGPTVMTVR